MNENLIPANKRSKEEARENGRKGGIASGKSRREKSDLRKAVQGILDGTYKDINGNQISGMDLIVNGILKNAANPNSKNWSKAIDVIISLTGANKTELENLKTKAETELLKSQAEANKRASNAESIDDALSKSLKETAEQLDGMAVKE